MNQGDIWLVGLPDLKPRPVLIVTRSVAMTVLNGIVVAPITSTLRDAPTMIPVGAAHGLDHDSVANFDALTVVAKAALVHRIGRLGPDARMLICGALSAMADC